MSLAFVFPFSLTSLGKSDRPRKCSHYTGHCHKCGKTTKFPRDLFCANFCWRVGGFPSCKMTWCGKCYTSHKDLKFHRQLDQRTAKANPTLNAKWRNKKPVENDYEFARPGDSLAVPFQCDLCIFRRITDEDPNPTSATNTLLLQYIRRANLDSFWS